jgi:hypothetical protein
LGPLCRRLLYLAASMGLVGGGLSGRAAAAGPYQTPWRISAAETSSFETPSFLGSLQTSSQTLVSLAPKGGGGFDFAPSGRFTQRLGDGYYRLGDIDLRLRAVGAKDWRDYSTAIKRGKIKVLARRPGVLAAADITSALGVDLPITVTRTWALEKGELVLRFQMTNRSAASVEIGGLGLPMIFDNIITGRTLDQAHEQASFYDPYVGEDAGYLQVTRLNGAGPDLLVLPEKQTPFELYKPILDRKNADGSPKIYNDPMPRSATFEGFYDWMVASKGFADTDWKGAQQWNEPTSLILRRGESRTLGVRLVLSKSIRGIEATLAAHNRPVAVGVPGYVAPTDLPATLFLHSDSPVDAVAVSPEGAMTVSGPQRVKHGWIKYVLAGKTVGRVRLSLTYKDGSRQTVQYLVTPPQSEVVRRLGRFLTTQQWFDDPKDPFHRAPSIMSYDRDAQKIVTQEPRVWIAGLSDEGGAGSYLAAIMKQLDNPDPAEVAKVETFSNQTLWGKIQVAEGPHAYGVHKSIFYYDPKAMPPGTYDPKDNWSTWTSWNKKDADDLGRSYNYVHVAAAWWSLYHIARYHVGLANQQTWRTYLTRAAETTKAMMADAPYYTQFGQMEGSVFVSILEDLRREGMTDEANAIEGLMKGRADAWATETYPFGSEMPWDSTGQAEVFDWMKYFGHEDKAAATREVILAYDPTIPHWGYNGSARRFWDFLYAGKEARIERQLHHYGSANNAIPLFESYRDNPADFYLLRVAYGGLMGSLTNIDSQGFGSTAFHSFPDAMKFDAYSGDYGMGFFAHAYTAASYIVDHPTFGWLGFGGLLAEANGEVTLKPRDSARSRVFVAPAGLWLTLNAGKIEAVTYDPSTGAVHLVLDAADPYTPAAFLDVSTPTKGSASYHVTSPAAVARGGYLIKLGAGETRVDLARSQ